MLDKANHVFVLNTLVDDTPTCLAVCSSAKKAAEARSYFMTDGNFGIEEEDYRIDAYRLDQYKHGN